VSARSPDEAGEQPRSADLKERARAVGLGLLFYGAVCFAGAFFAQQKLAAAGIQAALAEWSTGALGIAWSDPRARTPTFAQTATRAIRGALFGLATVALVIALAFVTRAAHVADGALSPAPLLLAIPVPALLAVRDELLLRGLILRVLSTTSRAAQLVACGLASIAAALGASDAGLTLAQIAVAGLSGVAFGALWQRDRGTWMAWGAHTAWSWGAYLMRSRFDATSTAWGGGDAGLSSGWVAVAVVAVAAIAASAWSLRDVRQKA
jgi:membrane protease YdiL (CAAX protease family)